MLANKIVAVVHLCSCKWVLLFKSTVLGTRSIIWIKIEFVSHDVEQRRCPCISSTFLTLATRNLSWLFLGSLFTFQLVQRDQCAYHLHKGWSQLQSTAIGAHMKSKDLTCKHQGSMQRHQNQLYLSVNCWKAKSLQGRICGSAVFFREPCKSALQ